MISNSISLEKFCKIVHDVFPSITDIVAGEAQYEECISHREIWDNLCRITKVDVNSIVVPFLNKWKCRLSYTCVPELTTSLIESEKWLNPLRKLTIEDKEIGQDVQSSKNVFFNVERAFKSICEVGAGKRTVGFTAASKILHMAIPDLFVMGDEAIRTEYGCEGNSAGYVNFILRMNVVARDLIHQASGNRQKILECSKWQRRTLARLLDNYNYTVFTLHRG
jgi:hypothetical protein